MRSGVIRHLSRLTADDAGTNLPHKPCLYSYQAPGTFWVHGDCESNTEFGNDANTRIEPRFAALWERHMGERRRRLTLAKQRRVGVARHPVKLRNPGGGGGGVKPDKSRP